MRLRSSGIPDSVVVFQQDAVGHPGRHIVLGGLHIPAPVVVGGDDTVHLNHELADSAAVDAVGLAGLLVVLDPVMANCVFAFSLFGLL